MNKVCEILLNTDLDQTTIAKWERGQRVPSIDCIIILCGIFNASADYILGLEDY